MADAAILQAALKALSDDYAAKLPEKLGQIEQTWKRLQQEGWNVESLGDLHRMVHSLTGSGKTFGFTLLSDVARNLEMRLKQLVQGQKAPDEEEAKRIEVLLSELRQVSLSRDVPASSHHDELETFDQPGQDIPDCSHIFIAGADALFAEDLKAQLGYYGYEARVFPDFDEFCNTLREAQGVVVLMDISDPEFSQRAIGAMKAIQLGQAASIPLIFFSVRDNFSERLEAARAGGIAYLAKPVNIGSLIDRLDALTSTASAVPYRILIIDDSEALTAYYASVLSHAGMEVRAVNNPLDTMKPLLEFAPDLILIDVYMPECNGMELAKIIRQQEAFVGIPIMFLSAESDIEKQLFAMGFGADGFLTKPIQPEHLISSVSIRAHRSLTLRSLMMQDSLTGLLNHTSIKDRLNYEMAQAKRRGTPLAFAMADIDHFKKVNDTYGHPAGDRVIKSLSRLLRQRMRETDLVGRYGGEEFAVILTNTNGEAAAKVLDRIRE
ncbi:MAG: diguanylate cyclase, partial [Gallionellaceae bacterium]|nr:diguanylate cyclase [Gallionellaceae bacterium]